VRHGSTCRWLSENARAARVHDLFFSAFSSEDVLRLSSLASRRQSGQFWFRSALSLRGKVARSLRNSIPGSDSYEFSSFTRIDGTLLGTRPRFPRVRSLARARECPITGTLCLRKVSNGILLHDAYATCCHVRTYLAISCYTHVAKIQVLYDNVYKMYLCKVWYQGNDTISASFKKFVQLITMVCLNISCIDFD
jgi:hypothetical protein